MDSSLAVDGVPKTSSGSSDEVKMLTAGVTSAAKERSTMLMRGVLRTTVLHFLG